MPPSHPSPTPILVFVVMYREICAFFLVDCSQWKVVWELFDRGGKQTQCPLGGLRKLENIDVSRSSLKGTCTYYAYYSQQCRERKTHFSLSYAKETFRLKLDPSEISSEYKC
jgi:hypothetical protein